MKITLPWPPSANTYWRHPTGGKLAGRHLISAGGRAYRLTVQQEVLVQHLRSEIGPLWGQRLAVKVEACPPDRRRRDLDNLLKALLDALQHGGVIQDDAHIDDLHVQRVADAKPGTVVVDIHTIAVEAG